MSVMSVSTVTMPSPSSRTRAADFVSRLLRNAAATPMPTSQCPSRVWPGCALRLLQPKRSAPRRRHSTSWRCENGIGEFSLSFGTCDCGSCEGGCPGLSGSTWVSLRMRNSTGSMPSFSAISSIAISSAIMPGASPGARIALPSGRSSTASRIAVMPVCAGIEQRASGMTAASGLPPGRSPDQLS